MSMRSMPSYAVSCPSGHPRHHWHREGSGRYLRCVRAVHRPSPARRQQHEPNVAPPRPNEQDSLKRIIGAERQRAKAYILARLPEVEAQAITYIFDADGFYENIADKMIEDLPYAKRAGRGHTQCKLLGVAAKLVDSASYEDLVGETVERSLKKLGVDDLAATAVSTGARLTIKAAFDASSFKDMSKAFRALIPLVCPNLSQCPERVEVLQTYATPLIADRLKEVAEALGAGSSPE